MVKVKDLLSCQRKIKDCVKLAEEKGFKTKEKKINGSPINCTKNDEASKGQNYDISKGT